MKHLCLLTLLWMPAHLFSQNWSVVNPTYTYNYAVYDSNHITNTILIDSIAQKDNDSVFYFNRVVRLCTDDTCSDYSNISPKYAFYNQPQFLQRKVIKKDSFYHFRDPENFIIKHLANVNEPWIFDSVNNIEAIVSEMDMMSLFNQTDSVKKIRLSNDKLILLSRNFGIISFESMYDECKYRLLGINDVAGEKLPDFFDYYNFKPGDKFEFHQYEFGADSYELSAGEIVEIISNNINGDTIRYDVRIERIWWYLLKAPWTLYPDWIEEGLPNRYYNIKNSEWEFINTPEHLTNSYNNQLINMSENLGTEKAWFTIAKTAKNSNGNYIIRTGFCDAGGYSNDYFVIHDSNNFILKTNNEFSDCCLFLKYEQGLGQIEKTGECFEGSISNTLYAYKKGNETVGNLSENYRITSNEYNKLTETTIFPNPAKTFINIPDLRQKLLQIAIFNIDGKLKKTIHNPPNIINIEELPNGIYIVKMNTLDAAYSLKLIIRR